MNLLLTLCIASAAMITIPTMNTMNAETTQTDSEALERLLPPPSEEEVSAQANSRNWVIFTIVWAIVTSLATAWFAWVVWRKDSVASDITQRRYGLATALALKATGELEQENLSLKTRLTEHDKQVAELTTAASDAKAAQQQVQTELAKQQTLLAAQQERAANAERQLEAERLARLDLEATLAPRRIAFPFPNPRLSQFAATPIRISYSSSDPETKLTADRIKGVAVEAGWQVTMAQDDTPFLRRRGVSINANDLSVEGAATELTGLLLANSIDVLDFILPPRGAASTWYPPAEVVPGEPLLWVVVGPKPDPYFGDLIAGEPVPVNDKHKELLETQKEMDKERAAGKKERIRRLREIWFPPGVNRIIL